MDHEYGSGAEQAVAAHQLGSGYEGLAVSGRGIIGQNAAPQRQRTFDGIDQAVEQLSIISAKAQAILDRICPQPREIQRADGAKAPEPPASYAWSLQRLHQRIGSLGGILDTIAEHI
jgi:hypothetical protein